MDLISILIPTYNRPEQVLKAINSCLDFYDGKVEVIIGDDSEVPNTRLLQDIKLPENYRLIYLHRKVPLKQNNNVQDLILRAQGKYSLLLHDDDYLLPESLTTLIKQAETESLTNCIYFGKQVLVDHYDKIVANNSLNEDYFRTAEYSGLQDAPLRMALLQQVPSNSFLFPTQVGQKIGYRSYEQVGDACDFDFITRLILIEKCELFFLNTNISVYRLSNESISRSRQYNSIFFKYKIVKELNIDSKYPKFYSELIVKDLNVLCGYFINNKLRSEVKKIYFSRYYPFKKRFTIRGIYHLIRCLF